MVILLFLCDMHIVENSNIALQWKLYLFKNEPCFK